jgi:three-Cys-motif partner protein
LYNYLLPEDDNLPMRESGPWALEKLDYLKRYIDVFETSMRKQWITRSYVDLLSGPGKIRIRDAGTVALGSPLLALTTRYPFTSYHFVDKDSDNAAALSQRCQLSAACPQTHVYIGDCNVLVDQIVAVLRQDQDSLNLAFLDPEGFELQWETIAKLASVRRMDLILNYPEGGLNRLMPQASQTDAETSIDRFFGDRAWRAIYREAMEGRSSGLHGKLIELLRQRLATLGYQEVRRDDEVGDEPLMRNAQRNAPLYRLLFASKDPLGKEFWRKITRRNVHGQTSLFEKL